MHSFLFPSSQSEKTNKTGDTNRFHAVAWTRPGIYNKCGGSNKSFRYRAWLLDCYLDFWLKMNIPAPATLRSHSALHCWNRVIPSFLWFISFPCNLIFLHDKFTAEFWQDLIFWIPFFKLFRLEWHIYSIRSCRPSFLGMRYFFCSGTVASFHTGTDRARKFTERRNWDLSLQRPCWHVSLAQATWGLYI